MEWQKAGCQTFQIMWSMNPHSDTVPPLQLRSFTSDSYTAIKERERKRDQRKKAAPKHRGITGHTGPRRESTSLDTAVDVRWTPAKLDDDAHMSDTRSLQPAAQEVCQVRSDAGIQQNIHRPSAQSTGPVEIDFERMTRCHEAATSDPSNPSYLGSTCPEPVTVTGLWVDPSYATDPEQSSPFAHEVDMIVSNDPEILLQELGSPLVHGMALASVTSSHSAPTHMCDADSNARLYKHPMQDGDSASPRPVSPQPNTLPELATTTGPSSNGLALATGLPDIQSLTRQDGYHGADTYLARLDQVEGVYKKRDSMPQAL